MSPGPKRSGTMSAGPNSAATAESSAARQRRRAESVPELPGAGAVVLQELTPGVAPRVESVENRVNDPGSTVDDVERRMKANLSRLALGDVQRIFVRYPAGVHAVHEDAVTGVVGRRSARHHVE